MKKKYNITSREAFTLHTKTTKTILLHRTYCSKPLLGNKRLMLDEIVSRNASKLVIIFRKRKPKMVDILITNQCYFACRNEK